MKANIETVILTHDVMCEIAKHLLEHAAEIIAGDDIEDPIGLLEVGAEITCDTFGIPDSAADQVFGHAAYLIARAMGHYPSPYGNDPITRYALSILRDHPWDEQVRCLRAAARR